LLQPLRQTTKKQRPHKANAQAPASAVANLARRQRGLGRCSQHGPRLRQQGLASRSDAQAPAGAVDQPHANGVFKLSDRHRQRWLGHGQARCSAAEMPLFGHSQKTAQVSQVEGHSNFESKLSIFELDSNR
jgi:hypothetical protein